MIVLVRVQAPHRGETPGEGLKLNNKVNHGISKQTARSFRCFFCNLRLVLLWVCGGFRDDGYDDASDILRRISFWFSR